MNRRRSDWVRWGAMAVASLFTASCTQSDNSAVTVTVIGQTPSVVDPVEGALDGPQKVLLTAVAQGLVRFDASGQIEPGLAERWNVSDDGLSYIFRLASGSWPNGRKIMAADIARLLRRELAAPSRNTLKDTVGAVDEVVSMTDRVLEIRLVAPRPNLLQLLAQPEFALVRGGEGTGPFTIDPASASTTTAEPGTIRLSRALPVPDGDLPATEHVLLDAAPVEEAVKAFAANKTELVLGGTFADLSVALGTPLRRGALRFDPALGLFGMIPARSAGPIGDPEVRALLSAAIDRDALVASLGVPDLQPRTSLLQPGLDNMGDPTLPPWAGQPIEARRPRMQAIAGRLFGKEPPTLRIALPDGPGALILLKRLQTDWGTLGVTVEAATRGQPADLRVLDAVAPSTSPSWFLRQFRCDATAVCAPDADPLLDAARSSDVAAQRAALFAEAERQMGNATLFIPLAAPVRWSLTGRGIADFVENRFARHPLMNLRDRPQRRD